MALLSPGVQVSVIDESNYIPAATNSVPYILLATAQNKVSGSGVGVAAGTLAANANKIYLMTSQRDLTATFGNPFFYKTTTGVPINGYELNEYGLLAAYSALGVSNRAYIQRVDIDLASLTASLVRPTGSPENGTYWLDTASTAWGIFEWNQTTGAFTVKTPIVITDTADLTSGIPSTSLGNIGDYAVVATNTNNPGYYKNSDNAWVIVGSDDWKTSWPTLQGSVAVAGTLTNGQTIVINGTSVAVPVGPNNTVAGLAQAITNASIDGVTAAEVDDKLTIYADSSAASDGSTAMGGIVVIESTSTTALLTALGITANSYYVPSFQQSPSYTVPRWRTSDDEPKPTGSVWNKTNAVNLGTNLSVKKYSSTLGAFVQQLAPLYIDDAAANYGLDPSGGGRNLSAGTTYAQYNVAPEASASSTDPYNNTYTIELFERLAAGPTIITGDNTAPTFTNGDSFTIQTSVAGSATYTTVVTATVNGTTAAAFCAAVSAANVSGVTASVDSTGAIVITQSAGGTIILSDVGGDTAVADAGINNTVQGVRDGAGEYTGALLLSNWLALTYTASATAPNQDPAEGRYWYYSATNQVDIMIQQGTGWYGYRNVTNDVRGYNLSLTDPAGPTISATAPTKQSDGTKLEFGDIWIDTSNLELYPVINRWEVVDGVDQWVTLDNTDQTTENGVLFDDARWDTTGTTDPITGNIPTIKSLLTSNYLDVDAPDYTLYPTGMLLFNTRRSGFNVKSFRIGYFGPTDFSYPTWVSGDSYVTGEKVLVNSLVYVALANYSGTTSPPVSASWALLETNAWVTASGNRSNGSPYMGRQAQRALIVAALKGGIDSNVEIREEQRQFNLQACPAYPELISNMIALNDDRSNTAFVIGDTPMRLAASGAEIISWATNNSGAGYITSDGLTISDPYAGVFYPSCQTTDLSGSAVVQPPSHMMVRTIIRNDEVAFPWLAPAGTRRGVIDNADAIGYINSQTGEFVTIGVNQGLRDVLYENKVNPITFVPGVGITNFGNKTIAAGPQAMDRINVARLVAFIRSRLDSIGKQYLFEPNDQITRDEIKNAINGLMIDLVAKRGIYDFLVICDATNNTPARIDANELWVDIAIEPVKAVEFIYIPLRLKNTGEIAAGQVATATAV
jgi:hypothetical protein